MKLACEHCHELTYDQDMVDMGSGCPKCGYSPEQKRVLGQ